VLKFDTVKLCGPQEAVPEGFLARGDSGAGRSGEPSATSKENQLAIEDGHDVMEWPNPRWPGHRPSASIWARQCPARRRAGFRPAPALLVRRARAPTKNQEAFLSLPRCSQASRLGILRALRKDFDHVHRRADTRPLDLRLGRFGAGAWAIHRPRGPGGVVWHSFRRG